MMQASKISFRSLGMALALCFGTPLSADIRVELPQTPVEQGQPFQITFEVSGADAAQPDLSPLAEDFQIVNRSTRQQTSVRNGVRSQRVTLTLALLPKRSGSLQIPSLAFGSEHSRAQTVSVLVGSQEDAQTTGPAADWPGMQYPGDPFGMPSPLDPFGMQASPYPAPQAAPPYPGPGPSLGGYDQTQTFTPPEPYVAPTWQESVPGVSSAEWPIQSAPAAAPTIGFPTWVVALLAAGWLATLAFCWLRNRKPQGTQQAPRTAAARPAEPKPKPLTAEEKALLAIRSAYEQADAAGARQALLAWAGLIWPEDAPSNLTKLAERLGDAARASIRKLDEALYSPTPVPWNDTAVWEHLTPAQGAPGSRPSTR